ncbi:MAG TPA: Ig-like domain-containing protein, partial [Ardenticatenaceae bacterium]
MGTLRSNKPLIIILLVAILALAGTGVWWMQQNLRPPEALQNPAVVEVLPAPAESVSRATTIEIAFDQQMDRASVEEALSVSPEFPYDVEWTSEGRGDRLIIRPQRALEWETTYEATLGTEAQNLEGRPLESPVEVAFTTGSEVHVAGVEPTPASTGVGLGQPITIRFDRPLVEVGSLEAQEELPQPLLISPQIEGVGRWIAPDTYGFYPSEGLTAGTEYEVTISSVIAPAMEMPDTYEWSFVTEGPRVEATFPYEGASEVERATSVRLLFNQPMDRESVENNFQLSLEGEEVPVAGEFVWEDDRTLVFVPTEALNVASSYQIIVGDEAMAAGGSLGMASPYRAVFATVDYLTVESVQPAPGSAEVTINPTDTLIAVQFNHPVVNLVGIADRESLPNPVNIAPAVEGEGEWLTTSLFTFRPTEPLEPSTEYVVTVEESLQDTVGSYLNEPYSWTFTTEFPRVIRVEPSNPRRHVPPTGPIGLRFNQPMARESTANAFQLLGPDGTPVSGNTTWEDDDTLLVFTPVPALTREQEYRVVLSEGAQGARGGVTGEAFEATVVAAPAPRVVSTNPEQGATNVELYQGIQFTFNTPIDVTRIEDHITLVPTTTEVFTYYDPELLTLHVAPLGGLQPSTDYTVTMDDEVRDESGQPLGEPVVLNFTTAALPPSLNLIRQSVGIVGTYNPYTPTLQIVSHRNISRMDFSLYRMSEEELIRFVQSDAYEVWDRYTGNPSALVEEWSVDVETTLNQSNLYRTLIPPETGELESGIYFLRVTAPERDAFSERQLESKQIMVMTPVNLTIKREPESALVWATDMESGQPASDVLVRLFGPGGEPLGEGRTDESGLLRLPIEGEGQVRDPSYALFALSYDDEQAVTGVVSTGWSESIGPWEFNILTLFQPQNLYGTIYSDRPLYRPGQTVYFKGVLRQRDGSALVLPTIREMELQINTPEGETFDSQPVTLSPFGTFEGEFTLDEDAITGMYSIVLLQEELGLCYGDYCNWEIVGGNIQVAEYERPEFQVTVEMDQDEVVQGEEVNATASASYFFGGALGEAPYLWRLYRQPYYFEVPGLSGYWTWQDFDSELQNSFASSRELVREGEGTLDEEGRATMPIETSLERGERPLGSQRLEFEAEVSDINDLVINGRDEVVVHAGEFYIGLSSESFIGEAGDEFTVSVATADTSAVLEGGHELAVEFYQREWFSVREQGETGGFIWTTSFSDTLVATRPAVTDEEGRATVSFTPEQGGSYVALAIGEDGQGNEVRSRLYFWVTDEEFVPWIRENNDRMDLVADKESYEVGDVARILVPTPFEGMTALVTEERFEISRATVQTLEGTAEVLEIPITEEMIPNMVISVVAVKGITDETPLPEFRVGYINLNVASDERQLTVEITPEGDGQMQPGDEATVNVHVTDAGGNPVEAELSLAIVDKAVLSLGGADQASLEEAFYSQRPLAVQMGVSLLANVDRLSQRFATEAKGGAGGGGGGGEFGLEVLRQNFLDTAYWEAQLVTDAEGNAQANLTLPDNLTTWVITAQAVTADETLVGEQVEELVATLPLLVRPTLPRFFVVGDQATLSVAVHNNSDRGIEGQVTFEAEGLTLRDDAEASRALSIPAGGREILTFPVTVEDVESASVTISAEGSGLSDAVRETLPVFHLTAPEVVATGGVLREGEGAAVENIQLPQGTEPSQGEFTLEMAPSLAGATESTLDWLHDYDYETVEAVVSAFLPNVATARALDELGFERPDIEEALRQEVTTGVQKLMAYQNSDGGWGWWAGDESQTWLTAYALLGLHEARDAGYEVPEERLARARRYLDRWLGRTAELQDNATLDTRAFVLYVLSETGEGDVGRTVELFDQHSLLNTDGRAFLLMALDNVGGQESRVQTLAAELTARAILSATGAHWEEENPDPWALDSSIRSTAVALRALVRVQPEHLLIPQTVRWLMMARANGYWETTQQSAWSVLALTDYMLASGELEADFSYEVALNGEVIASEQATQENLTEPVTLTVEMANLLVDEANQLIITRVEPTGGQSGEGRLYYSAWLRYYLPLDTLPARAEGVSVARRYEAVDAATLRSTGAEISEAEVGDLVQVRVTVNAPNDLYFFTLEDPIPAGFEAVDPSLLTGPAGAEGPQQTRTDERAENPFWYDGWSQSV